jgi:hypothetical protein
MPQRRVSSDGEVIWYRCSDCGGEGGFGYSDFEAIGAWNAYTPTPASEDAAGEALLRETLQRISEEPDHLVSTITIQRMRNLAGFALLGERLS